MTQEQDQIYTGKINTISKEEKAAMAAYSQAQHQQRVENELMYQQTKDDAVELVQKLKQIGPWQWKGSTWLGKLVFMIVSWPVITLLELPKFGDRVWNTIMNSKPVLFVNTIVGGRIKKEEHSRRLLICSACDQREMKNGYSYCKAKLKQCGCSTHPLWLPSRLIKMLWWKKFDCPLKKFVQVNVEQQ